MQTSYSVKTSWITDLQWYFFFSPTFIWEYTAINDTFRGNMSTDKCVLNKRQIYSPLGLTSAATLYVRRSLASHN